MEIAMGLMGSVARGLGLIIMFIVGGVLFLLGLGIVETSRGDSFLGGAAVVLGFVMVVVSTVLAEMKRRKYANSPDEDEES